MKETKLYSAFERLSSKSVDSVQNGQNLNDLDSYMHIDRPIEEKLKSKMSEIDVEGGGIILLVGSAGDGKSHLISRVRSSYTWGEDCFYNDATASSSPQKTATDTLKEALFDFNDSNIATTTKKIVLAINLGKLNAFIDDEEVKHKYSLIVKSVKPIFEDESSETVKDSSRIKLVMFSDEQIFEFYPEDNSQYPVDSVFLSKILSKIVDEQEDNPFYKAYKADISNGVDKNGPLIINYELLKLEAVRHTIVKLIIEAIICFKLKITPREYLDFLYSILVYPHLDSYEEKKNYFDALLPNLLFGGGDNLIQRAIFHLDPLKYSCSEHDSQLALLFTSFEIPTNFLGEVEKELPKEMVKRINGFYSNNGYDLEPTIKFVFRLKHLLRYHSGNKIFQSYLSFLGGLLKNDSLKMRDIYGLVHRAIPRHYGSYYQKNNMVPLNIKGGNYHLFSKLNLHPMMVDLHFDEERRNEFRTSFVLGWFFSDGPIYLKMDYKLFEYIHKLIYGKLAISYENEKNITFNRFVRQLAQKSDCTQEITVVGSDSKEYLLNETFGNIYLQ